MGFKPGSACSVRQWFTLVLLCVVTLVNSITTSIQAPFYPQEAAKKGASVTEYRLLFGVYTLVSFLACPIYGKYMDTFGMKTVLHTGLLVAGFSAMAFGLLHFVDSHAMFITLSFVSKILESLGTAAAITACFTIAATDFPGSVATAIATVDVFFGLGSIIGPIVGRYLYSVGGFSFPFMTAGGLLLSIESLIFFTMRDEKPKKRSPGSIISFLKVLPITLDVISTVIVSMGYGFYVATLEPHIRQFNLTRSETGAVFVCIGATYTLTATLVGRLCDIHVNPKMIIVVGSIFSIISFLLVGPMPYVNVNTKLWMVCLGLVVQGLGLACILVPAFIDSIRSAVASGFPDDCMTYAMVSGLMTSSFALGSCVGPSLAFVLFDAFGFRVETLFMLGMHAILLASMSWFIYTEQRLCRDSSADSTCDKSAEEGVMAIVETTSKAEDGSGECARIAEEELTAVVKTISKAEEESGECARVAEKEVLAIVKTTSKAEEGFAEKKVTAIVETTSKAKEGSADKDVRAIVETTSKAKEGSADKDVKAIVETSSKSKEGSAEKEVTAIVETTSKAEEGSADKDVKAIVETTSKAEEGSADKDVRAIVETTSKAKEGSADKDVKAIVETSSKSKEGSAEKEVTAIVETTSKAEEGSADKDVKAIVETTSKAKEGSADKDVKAIVETTSKAEEGFAEKEGTAIVETTSKAEEESADKDVTG